MVNTLLISWSLPHIPWGTPRSQRGVDSVQAQGQSPGQEGTLGSLLDSPSVTSHLLFRGLLEKHHCESHPWGQSQRLPTHSRVSCYTDAMEHRPMGKENIVAQASNLPLYQPLTNSAER